MRPAGGDTSGRAFRPGGLFQFTNPAQKPRSLATGMFTHLMATSTGRQLPLNLCREHDCPERRGGKGSITVVEV